MNFMTLHYQSKAMLINMDTVTEIHAHAESGALLIFNTLMTSCEQANVSVDESLSDIQELIRKLQIQNRIRH